jgi:hypothetical protein
MEVLAGLEAAAVAAKEAHQLEAQEPQTKVLLGEMLDQLVMRAVVVVEQVKWDRPLTVLARRRWWKWRSVFNYRISNQRWWWWRLRKPVWWCVGLEVEVTGGSGVVVLSEQAAQYPNTAAAVFSGGVATRSYDVVGYTTYEVQATTTTGETVTFYPNAFLAEYLVVAGVGGGGGRAGGGGGAGGYLASANTVAMAVVRGQAYPVIVGAGGAGSPNGVGGVPRGVSGSDSQFASVISTGGGAGGASANGAGLSGGSAGGRQDDGTIPAGNTPFRSPSQGNAGGNGSNDSPEFGGGGGGGVSAVGSDGTSSAGGNGGAGTPNSITGSSLNYAGGGGGGAFAGPIGGSGGSSVGGAGGGVTAPGGNGTANRGGGGGGGGGEPSAGGTGGSGVVVIKIPNTRSATFTGGVTANGNTGGSITPDTSVGV